MKKCMLRPIRVAAGLGNPPRQMAKPENRGIQHCYKRGDFQTKTDQVTIHDLIEKRVVQSYLDELVKAIYPDGRISSVRRL